jgi:hypothetical protein
MRDAVASLLVNVLTHEIQMQRAAMESPQLFRKLVRDNNSGIQVPYMAGLPLSLEEELHMLLDAGSTLKDFGSWRIWLVRRTLRCSIF